MTALPAIYGALADVMADVKAVAKTDRNQAQNFQFRGIDGVLNAVGPALRRHRVVVLPITEDVAERTIPTRSGGAMNHVTVRVRYRFATVDGSSVEVVVPGESSDVGDKGVTKAMSVAYRTALIQTLALPTDEPDPDSFTYERSAPLPMTSEQHSLISAALADLDEPQQLEVRAWWKAQRLPKAERLSHDEAERVIARLGEVA